MDDLQALIGVERDLGHVSDVLQRWVRRFGAAVVGAQHVVCSDEAEWECLDAFQRQFADGALPELKPGDHATFHTVNLGARYEWGSVRVAEEHYAAAAAGLGAKLLVVKINAHVAVRETADGQEYGRLRRFDADSNCCGALAALLAGATIPAVRELAELFAADGLDRVGMLRDAARVPPSDRALRAAMVNALLQARRAAEDIRRERPRTPTIYLVLPCTTVNRPGPDTEIVAGLFHIDFTGDAPRAEYRGLGADPSGWSIRHPEQRAVIEDAQWPPRGGRGAAACSR